MVWAGEYNEGFNLKDDDIDEGFGVKDDGKDKTRQLALRLASLGCLVVCIDRDGDTNKTTVSDIQVNGNF